MDFRSTSLKSESLLAIIVSWSLFENTIKFSFLSLYTPSYIFAASFKYLLGNTVE